MIKKYKAIVPTIYRVVADIDVIEFDDDENIKIEKELEEYPKAKYLYRCLNETFDRLFEDKRIRGYIVLKAISNSASLTIDRVYWDNEENKEGGDKCLTK